MRALRTTVRALLTFQELRTWQGTWPGQVPGPLLCPLRCLSTCAFPHISATSRLYQLRVCVQVRTFLLFFRDLQAFFFSLFALVRSTFACGTPWQSTWPGQTFRIASAARELHHSHPAFQWGPGRLFHRDGARVLIDSAPLDDRTATVQLAPLISWPQCLSYDDLERTAVRSKKVLGGCTPESALFLKVR